MSTLIEHFKRELALTNEETQVVEALVKIAEIVGDMGHSGSSSVFFNDVLNRLLRRENLTPLTTDPLEWEWHSADVWGAPGGIYQNLRNSRALTETPTNGTYWISGEPRHIRHPLRKPPIVFQTYHNRVVPAVTRNAIQITEENLTDLVAYICGRGGAATGHNGDTASGRPARIRLKQLNTGLGANCRSWAKYDWRVFRVGDYIITHEKFEDLNNPTTFEGYKKDVFEARYDV